MTTFIIFQERESLGSKREKEEVHKNEKQASGDPPAVQASAWDVDGGLELPPLSPEMAKFQAPLQATTVGQLFRNGSFSPPPSKVFLVQVYLFQLHFKVTWFHLKPQLADKMDVESDLKWQTAGSIHNQPVNLVSKPGI